MSYKNAMAGLPMGGGKAVILADDERTKTPEMLAAFGDAIEALGGRYVTAEDVGMSEADMVAISQRTAHVCGLPVGEGDARRRSGPVHRDGHLPRHQGRGRAQAGQGQPRRACTSRCRACGSVGGGVARLLAQGRRAADAWPTSMPAAPRRWRAKLGGEAVAAEAIMGVACDVFSPNALGAILDEEGIARLDCADRRGRREQPARARPSTARCWPSAASSTRPIT